MALVAALCAVLDDHQEQARPNPNLRTALAESARLNQQTSIRGFELFRHMVLNIAARNQDDHVKNIAFLMNKQGGWALEPAYDMTYSYNTEGAWTATHQMTMNGRLR